MPVQTPCRLAGFLAYWHTTIYIYTYSNTPPLSQEQEIIIKSEKAWVVKLGAPESFTNDSPDDEAWLALEMAEASSVTVTCQRWVAFATAELSPSDAKALERYLAGTFECWAVGKMPDNTYTGVVMKQRNRWDPPVTVLSLSLGLRARDNVFNRDRVVDVLSAWRSAVASGSSTMRLQHDSTADEAEALFWSIHAHWMLLSPREIEAEIACAKVAKKRRTATQCMIVSSSGNLKAVVDADKRQRGLIRWTLTDPRIPEWGIFNSSLLDSIMARTFCVETGNLLQCSLRDYIMQAHYLTHALILTGPPGMGKTPLALCLAKTISQCWGDEAGVPSGEQNLIVTSQWDSLRLAVPTVGTTILLDEWSPSSSHAGRSKRISGDDLKQYLQTIGGCLPTRYGDTCLPPGGRLVTSNADGLATWAGLGSDGFETMSNAQRLSLARSTTDTVTGAVHKRAFFARVTTPLVKKHKAEENISQQREGHLKRLRAIFGEDVD